MLAFIGDIHGDFWALERLLKEIPPEAVVIQVGDFGIWPRLRRRRDEFKCERDIFFIDGNHDHIPSLPLDSEDVVEVWPRALYVPRGKVLTLDGKRILFLGGAKSVDRKWREKGGLDHGWFEEEQISEAQVSRAIANGPVDLIVSHAPPDFVIRTHFSEDGLRHFGHNPRTWVDESARAVERVWKELGKPPLICGHMHRHVQHGNILILDINEVFLGE